MKIDSLSENWMELITKHQFYLFLEQLLGIVKEAQLTELEYKLSGIIATYDALIEYFQQGVNDPERERVYQQLIGQALLIGDKCTIALHGAQHLPYYTAQHKIVRHKSFDVYLLQLEAFTDGIRTTTDTEKLRQLALTHDKQLSELFTDLWTHGAWDTTMATEADKLLLSSTITTADQCTIVSAVTLSLLRSFDPHKLLFLCDAYYHPQAIVSMRALVGIVIICHCWPHRIEFYNEAKARLALLSDDPVFSNQVCEVILQFTRSADTEEIDRKMREEIIPELMKNPKLRKMPNIKKEELNADDINPDWEQWMHESGLEESMREITEWQMEGADVNMSTFSQLKRYPFFYNICNWFRPFDMWQADMLHVVGSPNNNNNTLAKTILQSNYMCDSDKYSFCYAIREIPQMQREAMMAQLEEQNNMMKENADMPDLNRLSKQTTQSIIRQYIQNLYRFFKLFPNIQEFDNPFDELLLAINRKNPLYRCITGNPEQLFKFIGLNIKRKDYWYAIRFFDQLNEWHPDCMEATQLQQLGLCYQKEEMYDEAIECYIKADILQPNSYWTIHHLAQCYHKNLANDKALEYYEIAENMKPDNLNLTFHVAEILYEQGEYDKALPRLHKIDYHHPEALKSLRLLAECHMYLHKFEQATKYYERMEAEHTEELIPTDWKMIAYNAWMMGRYEDFFRCMQKAETLYNSIPREEVKIGDHWYVDKVTFADTVYTDNVILSKLGCSNEEQTYIYDTYHRNERRR